MNKKAPKLLLLALLVSGATAATAWSVTTPAGCGVLERTDVPPFSQADIDLALEMTQYWIDQDGMSATIVESPANIGVYNCYNYAWSLSEGGQAAWMFDDSAYWSTVDGCAASYAIVELGSGSKVGYPDHAGIYIDVSNCRVRSKWGNMGLVEHNEADLDLIYGAAECAYERLEAGPSTVDALTVLNASARWNVIGYSEVPVCFELHACPKWDDGPWNVIGATPFRGVGSLTICKTPSITHSSPARRIDGKTDLPLPSI